MTKDEASLDREARAEGFSSETAWRFPRRDGYREVSLEEENHHLRQHVEQLRRELYEAKKRHTLVLPNAADVTHSVWVVPLRVGEVPLSMSAFDPLRLSHYRLNFERDWSTRGVFWRVLPFTTDPEAVKR